jgi:signal transduction histidine kinase
VTYRSAKNVYNLLENLLSWSKMQMDRMEYRPIEVDLKMAVNLNILLLGTNAFNKNIALKNNIADVIMVYADEDMLHSVIRNVISNGLKFTHNDGTVVISAKVDGEFVEVSVVDDGMGISADDLEKLFKLEVYHTTLGTADEKGTGFGLIMCKEMVERNQGQIWIESEPGKGTTVKFTVPLASKI